MRPYVVVAVWLSLGLQSSLAWAAAGDDQETVVDAAAQTLEQPIEEDAPAAPVSDMAEPVAKGAVVGGDEKTALEAADNDAGSTCDPECFADPGLGYLSAAEALIKAERADEALRLYRKVLTLNLDPRVHERAQARLDDLAAVDLSLPAPGRYYGMFLGAESGLALTIGSLATLDALTDANPPGEMIFLLASGATVFGAYSGKQWAQSYRLTRAEGEAGLLLGNWAAIATAMSWSILERQGLVDTRRRGMGAWIPLSMVTLGTGGMLLGVRSARHLALDRGSATLAWLGTFVGATDADLLASALGGSIEDRIPDLILAGSLTGMALGTWWGRQASVSANRARLLSLGSYLGMASFAAGASLLGNEDGQKISGATVMGSFTGIGLAYLATTGLERGASAQLDGLEIGPPMVLRDDRGLRIYGPLMTWRW
ncbi:MAG: hypothetical protein CMH55_09805 [Myxococcales bacterium]|nr:hypothetical protein [Myxococcales bacterium]